MASPPMAPAKIPIKASTSVLSTKVALPRLDIVSSHFHCDVTATPIRCRLILPGPTHPWRIAGKGLNPVELWFPFEASERIDSSHGTTV
jgi:hypothetical protein